jgi:hypothetical protein
LIFIYIFILSFDETYPVNDTSSDSVSKKKEAEAAFDAGFLIHAQTGIGLTRDEAVKKWSTVFRGHTLNKGGKRL